MRKMASINAYISGASGRFEQHAFATVTSAKDAASSMMRTGGYFKVDIFDDNGRYITTAWGE